MGSKNIMRLWQRALVEKDPLAVLSTDTLTLRPQADDTGTLAFGDGSTDMNVKFFVGTTTDFALFDVGNGQLTLDSMELQMGDSDEIEFGDGTAGAGDVYMAWDGTDFDVTAAADDSIFKFGSGTNSFDVWIYGDIPTAYTLWDASASTIELYGPVRPVGFNGQSTRYELKWTAGRGKPGINADIQNASEAVRMIADPDFEILGVNGVSASTSIGVEGGVVLTTAGAEGDEVILVPHLDTSQSAWGTVTWGTDRETHWEAFIRTGASLANVIIWAGLKLTNTEVVATDNDQIYFRTEDDVGSGVWQLISSRANVDTTFNTTFTAATATNYHLKLRILSDLTCQAWINGTLVNTAAALVTAKDFIPYIGIQNDGGAGAAKTVNVYGQSISRLVAAS